MSNKGPFTSFSFRILSTKAGKARERERVQSTHKRPTHVLSYKIQAHMTTERPLPPTISFTLKTTHLEDNTGIIEESPILTPSGKTSLVLTIDSNVLKNSTNINASPNTSSGMCVLTGTGSGNGWKMI
jgi:hypothetical protein